MSINYWDVEKLGLMMLGYTDDESDDLVGTEKLETILADKYEISFDSFANIISRLIEFTPTVQSALSNNEYHAFVKGGVMIIKEEITHSYCHRR